MDKIPKATNYLPGEKQSMIPGNADMFTFKTVTTRHIISNGIHKGEETCYERSKKCASSEINRLRKKKYKNGKICHDTGWISTGPRSTLIVNVPLQQEKGGFRRSMLRRQVVLRKLKQVVLAVEKSTKIHHYKGIDNHLSNILMLLPYKSRCGINDVNKINVDDPKWR